jgi:hypothetical protein
MRTGWRRRTAPLPWPGRPAGGGVTISSGTTRSRRSRRSRGRGAGTAVGPALVMTSGWLELLTLAHRQEGVPGRYRGLEQRRRLSPDVSTRAVRGHPSRVPAVPISPSVKALFASPSCLGDERRHHRRLPLACQSCNVASMGSRRATRVFAGLLPAAITPETADKEADRSAEKPRLPGS